MKRKSARQRISTINAALHRLDRQEWLQGRLTDAQRARRHKLVIERQSLKERALRERR